MPDENYSFGLDASDFSRGSEEIQNALSKINKSTDLMKATVKTTERYIDGYIETTTRLVEKIKDSTAQNIKNSDTQAAVTKQYRLATAEEKKLAETRALSTRTTAESTSQLKSEGVVLRENTQEVEANMAARRRAQQIEEQRASRSFEQRLKARERAEERATRIVEQGLQRRQRAEEQANASFMRRLQEREREQQRVEKQATRNVEQGLQRRQRTEEKANNNLLKRLKDREAAQYKAAAARNKLLTSQRYSSIEMERLSNHYKNLERTQGKAVDSTKRLRKETDRVTKSTKNFEISWKSIVRLFAVQMAHRGMSQLMRGIEEGMRRSIDLQKRLAEVRTISQNQQLTLDKWAAGLREVSASFGLDILDSAEAAYQTLSNQVVEGAESFEFLNQTARFAVTTNSTLAESVNLLTAAINSFQLSASDTRDVAAKMFKTIELGRVRTSDMAESFGDVSVMAQKLGLKLDDLLGTIQVLTIQGLKYNRAATQLRGIFVKLLKPTGEMKKFFKSIGVDSGEAAVQTYGFAGVLQKMQEYTKGSTTELAKLVTRIRGLTGALGLTGKHLETYKQRVKDTEEAQKSYAKGTEIVMETAAKKLEKSIESIKNIFLVDLGNSLTRTFAYVNKEIVNFEAVVRGLITTLKYGLPPAVAASTVALVHFHPVIAGITAAVTVATVAFARFENRAIEATRKANEAIERQTSNRIRVIRERFEEERKRTDEHYKRLLKLQANYNIELNQQLERLNSDIERANKRTKDSFERIFQGLKDRAKSIRRQVSEARQGLHEARSALESLQRRQEEFELNELLKGKDAKQQLTIFKDLAKEQAKAAEAATYRGKLDLALEHNRKRLRYLEEAYQTANLSSEEELRLRKRIKDAYEAAKESAKAYRAAEAKNLETYEARLESIEKQIENTQKKLKELLNFEYNKREDIEEQTKEYKELQNELLETIGEQNTSVFDRISLERDLNRLAERRATAARLEAKSVLLTEKAQKTRLARERATRLRKKEQDAETQIESQRSLMLKDIEKVYNQIDNSLMRRSPGTTKVDEKFDEILERLKGAKGSVRTIETTQDFAQVQRTLLSIADDYKTFRDENLNDILTRSFAGRSINETQRSLESLVKPISNTKMYEVMRDLVEIQKKRLEAERKEKDLLISKKKILSSPLFARNFSSGGEVGTDTVNAMLAPGEFVLNRNASSRFYSQLQSLNSGGRVGQNISNTNVGDVNINYRSTGSQSIDVVALGNALSREISRGRVKL